MSTEQTQAMDDPGQGAARDEKHPRNSVYLIVAAFLAVLTAMEITVFYVHAMRPILVPVLLMLSGAKFAMVVLFFMHLRYDAKAFTLHSGVRDDDSGRDAAGAVFHAARLLSGLLRSAAAGDTDESSAG